MRPKHSGQPKASAERVVKDVRRATRRHFSANAKSRRALIALFDVRASRLNEAPSKSSRKLIDAPMSPPPNEDQHRIRLSTDWESQI